MQKWEYFIYYSPTRPTAEELNDYGDDGWELVWLLQGDIPSGGKGYMAYLKRLKS